MDFGKSLSLLMVGRLVKMAMLTETPDFLKSPKTPEFVEMLDNINRVELTPNAARKQRFIKDVLSLRFALFSDRSQFAKLKWLR